MRRLAHGDPASLPPTVLVHMVAARYGQTPEAVRRWPADDFAMALSCMPVTALVTVPMKDG